MGKSGSFFHAVAATAAAGKPIRAQSRAGLSVDNMTPRETISLSSGRGGNVGITGPAWSCAEWAGSLGTINPALLDLCWVKCRYVTTDTAALNLTVGTSKKKTTTKKTNVELLGKRWVSFVIFPLGPCSQGIEWHQEPVLTLIQLDFGNLVISLPTPTPISSMGVSSPLMNYKDLVSLGFDNSLTMCIVSMGVAV